VDVTGGPTASIANVTVLTLINASFYVRADSMDFTDDSSAGTDPPIVAWTWDFGGGQTSTAQDPGVITYAAPGTCTVTLTIETVGGLMDTTSTNIVIEQGFDDVFDDMQTKSCGAGGCHSGSTPAAGLDLSFATGADQVFANLREGMPSATNSCSGITPPALVTPGNLTQSLLWDNTGGLHSCGFPMPYTTGLTTLQDWITGGAAR
jgi:PKD repeat protein